MSFNNQDMEIRIHRLERILILPTLVQQGQLSIGMRVQEKEVAISIIHRWKNLKVLHLLSRGNKAHSTRSPHRLEKRKYNLLHISIHSH